MAFKMGPSAMFGAMGKAMPGIANAAAQHMGGQFKGLARGVGGAMAQKPGQRVGFRNFGGGGQQPPPFEGPMPPPDFQPPPPNTPPPSMMGGMGGGQGMVRGPSPFSNINFGGLPFQSMGLGNQSEGMMQPMQRPGMGGMGMWKNYGQ